MTNIPETERSRVAEDLQTHARSLAIELGEVGVGFDTIERLGDTQDHLEGWEVPAKNLPAAKPLMIGQSGLYISEGPRITGREVRLINANDIAPHGAALAIRQKLYALETKHDIFEKIKTSHTSVK